MSTLLTPADASAPATLVSGGRSTKANGQIVHVSPQLLDVQAVATLLGCSPRTVYRLSDSGKMPSPVKLGALIRWNRAAVEEWIAAGCPSVRRAGK